ncbi:MAG TPA: hypothetical protein VIK81_04905 [Patescibacteria group bacterium]
MRNLIMQPARQQYSSAILGRFSARHIFFFLAAIIGFLLILQIILSNILATSGENLAKIDSLINQTKQENSKLKAEIAQEGSLSNVETKAKELGMIEASKFVYIDRTVPVAQNLR